MQTCKSFVTINALLLNVKCRIKNLNICQPWQIFNNSAWSGSVLMHKTCLSLQVGGGLKKSIISVILLKTIGLLKSHNLLILKKTLC